MPYYKFKEPADYSKIAKGVLIMVILLSIVFLIYFSINNREKPIAPIAPVATSTPKAKTMEEIIESLSAPIHDNKQQAPISKEVIKSLSSPVETVNKAKNNKEADSAPDPIPKDIIDSLSVPIK